MSVNVSISTFTYIWRFKRKSPTLLSLICSTYFWTVGWGFTVATDAGPPTVVEGSWFSVAWFSCRSFLRMGFDGGWEYGISCGLRTRQKTPKVKKLNGLPSCQCPRSGMYSTETPHPRVCGWFTAQQELEGHVHQIPVAFLSFLLFFHACSLLPPFVTWRTQESGSRGPPTLLPLLF